VSKSTLNLSQTKEMLIEVSQKMIGKKDELTKADQVIGDGDHGIGMARGFEAIEKALSENEFESIPKLLNGVGTAMMMSVGGASGAIFGTLFKGGSKNISSDLEFNSDSLSVLLNDGLEAIKKRGGAKLGDKTMIDALEPAAVAAKEQADAKADLAVALDKSSQAAGKGRENSKDLIATMGRAKTLGERCLGHADPGAISMAYILEFMNDYTQQN